MSVSGYVHMCAGACGGQKRAIDLQELELQVFKNHPMWVLGTELWSPARAAPTLNHRAVPQLLDLFYGNSHSGLFS